ncbi:MAG: M23 family metallopeptidase [Rubrivivax sp.]
MASAFTALTGFAVTAVAVAPMMPDAALLPQRLVVEAVVPAGMDAQLAALAAVDLPLSRGDITRSTDTADALLSRLGVRDAAAAVFLRTDPVARLVLAGRGGKMVQAETASDGSLTQLTARFPALDGEQARTHFTRLTMAQVSGQWQARIETAPFETRTRLASGTIKTSLFAATDEANVPDAVAAQLAEIFSTDIDFRRELRKGDTFSLLYETLTADGEPVAWGDGIGRVQAAEFVNDGKAQHAIWYSGADGRGAYFDIDGASKSRAFLSSPLAFSRVTSGFAMRFHPLLQSWRQHLGVDYAAPTGTEVRVVGDGVVEFSGVQNGYGNVVKVSHANKRDTLYAHLSRIDVKKGQRVQKGQSLGAVGSTGWATGPHLHFEFMIGDQHQDPLMIAKGSESIPMAPASRPRFLETVRTVQLALDVAQTLGTMHAQAD